MSDPYTVVGVDGIRRSLDEHYDAMMEVEQDPYGAWLAIQNQAQKIEALEARVAAAQPKPDAVQEAAQLLADYLETTYQDMSWDEISALPDAQGREYLAYLYALGHISALAGGDSDA